MNRAALVSAVAYWSPGRVRPRAGLRGGWGDVGCCEDPGDSRPESNDSRDESGSDTGSGQDRDTVGAREGNVSPTAMCITAGRGQGGFVVRAALMVW